jgi:DNA-binding CsgD family transcriptional regulator
MQWIQTPSNVSIDIDTFTEALSHIGAISFDIKLRAFVSAILPVAEISGYQLLLDGTPWAPGWSGERVDTALRTQAYVDGMYAHDPIIRNLPKDAVPNTNYHRSMSVRSVTNDDYRWTFFDEPGFRTEVASAFRDEDGWSIVKFYLEEADPPRAALELLGMNGALAFALGKRHVLNANGDFNMNSRPMAHQRLSARLARRFPQLTEREREVCTYTMLGTSAPAIANALEVSTNTVMTYRRRAYKRLGVSNAGSLLKEVF